MKKREVGKIFKKLNLSVKSTGHYYGWLVVEDKKILRVHYSHGKGDISEKIEHKIRAQLKYQGSNKFDKRVPNKDRRDRLESGKEILGILL